MIQSQIRKFILNGKASARTDSGKVAGRSSEPITPITTYVMRRGVIAKNIGGTSSYNLYGNANLYGTISGTPTVSSSNEKCIYTLASAPSVSGTVSLSDVAANSLYNSTFTCSTTGYPFSSVALTYMPNKGFWAPIVDDSDLYPTYCEIPGHQGYVTFYGVGSSYAFALASMPKTGTTFVGKVAQTTESSHTVHRITLGYGQDGLDIVPFYSNPTYWKNLQYSAHFRIELQSTSGLTSAPYITYLRIPYYNGATATYTDYPIRVNGDMLNTVDIRELGGYYLDVTFSDNSAQGFYITNLLPDGDLVNY